MLTERSKVEHTRDREFVSATESNNRGNMFMKIKNVLVTGAGGKIGRAVLPELAQAGYAVRALQYTDGLAVPGGENIEVVSGDLREPSLAKQLIADMDAVIHLANVKENKELFLDTNVKGTFHLLDACKEAGHIQQYIQAGSDARAGIYYYPQPIPIDENHRHSGYPGYYPLSKVLEEVLCEQYQIMYRTPITILRFSWVHDEDDISLLSGVGGSAGRCHLRHGCGQVRGARRRGGQHRRRRGAARSDRHRPV